ncbi:DNA glycosylase AlkZ-like family protein [Nocardiopsis sp. FIRDI 009]|uniref:DNA glycosylase AlkZ-like family protein n=1 Tax=Nocardiopsis sp. FIRDI 009 TaxID=714197 RepID=UPI000E24364A|nr:crosslink repair DNA glycosylase YcaQ family protein [Nocardiopsis sp. FIRDI 009]
MTPELEPLVVDAHRLSDGEASRLWQWVLARQGLAPRARLASVEETADLALGLHAARLPSPFQTAAARIDDSSQVLRLLAPAGRGDLVTVRCMRKTLHTLPLPLAAAAHAATRHFRERDALRAMVNAQVPEGEVAAVTADLVALLNEQGPTGHRDIEQHLATHGRAVPAVRVALKLAWERGVLTYANTSGVWNRERRTFDVAARAYPGLDTAMSRERGAELLMAAYLDRYGPVSMRDATWWSALSRRDVEQAWLRAGVKLVKVAGPSWSPQPMVMSADRFEEFAHARPQESGAHLLAHEDVALKAYFETRTRYLGPLPAAKAFNQIGEVLPTVVVDGRVVGTWAWDHQGRRVRHRLVPGATSANVRPRVRAAAQRMSGLLRAGLDHTLAAS